MKKGQIFNYFLSVLTATVLFGCTEGIETEMVELNDASVNEKFEPIVVTLKKNKTYIKDLQPGIEWVGSDAVQLDPAVSSRFSLATANGKEIWNLAQNATTCVPATTKDLVKIPFNTKTTINVLANDLPCTYALDLSSLSLTFVPFYGSTSVSGGKIIYTPLAGHNGVDRFTYCINAKKAGASTLKLYGIVELEVGNISSSCTIRLNPDVYTLRRQSATSVDSTFARVLLNDVLCKTDPSTSISISVSPANGVAAIRSGNIICYKPKVGWEGTDVITYKRCIGTACQTATASFKVLLPSTTCKSIAKDDTYTSNILINKGVIKPIVIQNDAICAGGVASITISSPIDKGTVRIASPSGMITYAPLAGYKGKSTFKYTVKDKLGTSTTATVVINNI